MLSVREGAFDLRDVHSLVIGSELAAGDGGRVGDVLSLTSFASGADGRLLPRRDTFVVRGIFHTGYYDFDTGLVFMSLAAAEPAAGGGAALARSWGIKISNRFDDSRPLKEMPR